MHITTRQPRTASLPPPPFQKSLLEISESGENVNSTKHSQLKWQLAGITCFAPVESTVQLKIQHIQSEHNCWLVKIGSYMFRLKCVAIFGLITKTAAAVNCSYCFRNQPHILAETCS
jgi:hypothetical protein